jgi:endonuclease/exonuclease/phosphatase family metal-dependent hydrolase
MSFSSLLLLVPVLVLLPSASTNAGAAAPAAVEPAGEVRVAAANLFEGAVVDHPADLRDGTDRRAFVSRLMGQVSVMPDVVLLQEVLGTAPEMARTLNAHPRTAQAGAHFVVLGGTDRRFTTGSCDGARPGRFMVLRASAILVNADTVTGVQKSGVIRTWGRWDKWAYSKTGNNGYGCTEHPWARVTVKHPGTAARTAIVASVHMAPAVTALKDHGLGVVRKELDQLHAITPEDAVVLGGDFNSNRCNQSLTAGEQENCAPRPGHRSLLDNGYVDAVRSLHLTGPDGVVGVARRVDYIYAKGGEVTASSHDRCYRAYFVHQWPCSAARSVFDSDTLFHKCEYRALHNGSPGGGCSAAMYRRYYSDHIVLFAIVQ